MSDNIDELLDGQSEKNEEERGADKWDPKAGDQMSGYLLKSGWYDGGDYEPSLWILVKDEEGETHRVYCPTVLKNQILEENPAIGSGIAIRYEGKQPTKNNPKRSYHAYTFVLVPNDKGEVKRDFAYWQKNGVYRGPQADPADAGKDTTSFF